MAALIWDDIDDDAVESVHYRGSYSLLLHLNVSAAVVVDNVLLFGIPPELRSVFVAHS